MSRMLMTAAGFLIAVAPHAGATDMKVAGTMKASVIQQQVLSTGAGYVALMNLEKGSSHSPGAPLDGATIMLAETALLDNGNGLQTGTITLANEKGSVTNEIHGAVKTIMVNGQPRVSTSGTYKMIGGTGIFTGGNGHGTYSASFTSKMDWAGEYKGTLVLPRRTAER